MDSRDLESTESGQDIVARVIVILVGNQLAVDLLLKPGLGNFVKQAIGVWHKLLNRRRAVCEKLGVLCLVVARVPLML